jgi:hypothetical protein
MNKVIAALLCLPITVVVFAPAAPSSAATTGPPEVALELLSLSEMPAGWAQFAPTVVRGPSNCSDVVSETMSNDPPQWSAVGFDQNRFPLLEELVASWATPAGPDRNWQIVNGLLARCQQSAEEVDGLTVHIRMSSLSLGEKFGSPYKSYQLKFSVKGIAFGADLTISCKGYAFVALEYEALGTPDLNTYLGFLTSAMGNVQG